MFIKSKIQFFESKSQPYKALFIINLCCLSSQRYNFLKANHNISKHMKMNSFVVYQVKDTIFWKQITTWIRYSYECETLFIKSKIQFFESKSQQKLNSTCLSYVVYQVKDTIFWKQITTANRRKNSRALLFIKSKIQFFESKSQHTINRLSNE